MALLAVGEYGVMESSTGSTSEVWADTRPGPMEVWETGPGWQQSSNPSELYERRDYLIHKHQDHKKRVRVIRDIITGEWERQWPGMSAMPSVPAVANTIEQAYAHWCSIFGGNLPQIKVPVPQGRSMPGGKIAARKRERRLRELFYHSKLPQMSALLAGDLCATGSATSVVWANFEERNPSKRMPYIMRIDPLHTFPMKDEHGNITELLVCRRWDAPTWVRNHPEYKSMFGKTDKADLEEWLWFTPEDFKLIVADTSGAGRRSGKIRILHSEKNHLGRVPAFEAVTATVDSQRRGMFDQALGPLYHAQLLALYAVKAVEQELYPPLIEYGAEDVDTVGPGGIISLTEKDGHVSRLESRSTSDIRVAVAQQLEFVRQQIAFPSQLQGETGGSIVSAQGVQAVQGQIDSRLAYGHKTMEVLFSELAEMMLEVDEHYCPGSRTIYGDSAERMTGEAYDPRKDVKGNYRAMVSYGMGAGSDQTNKEMRLNTAFQTGAISMETYQNELGYVKDPDLETMSTAKYELFQSLKDRARQQILAGEINDEVAMVIDLVSETDTTIEKVTKKLVEGIQNSKVPMDPSQMGGQGEGQMPMPQEGIMQESPDGLALAENIARGGDGQNPGQNAGPLPPVETMLSGQAASRTL